MITNGGELVTNIKIAAECLQMEHREQTEEKMTHISEMLDNEARESMERFREIAASWPTKDSAKMKGAPTELFELILTQKEQCNDLLRSKNELIEMLEAEDRTVDESYKELIEE